VWVFRFVDGLTRGIGSGSWLYATQREHTDISMASEGEQTSKMFVLSSISSVNMNVNNALI